MPTWKARRSTVWLCGRLQELGSIDHAAGQPSDVCFGDDDICRQFQAARLLDRPCDTSRLLKIEDDEVIPVCALSADFGLHLWRRWLAKQRKCRLWNELGIAV
jgi:hypothetical protein